MHLLRPTCIAIYSKFAVSHIVFLTLLLLATPVIAHGPGHQHTAQSSTPAFIANDFSFSGNRQPGTHQHPPSDSKAIEEPLDERIWGASLMGGWESRHVHYGVNESGNNTVLFSEAAAHLHNLYLSAWAGFAIGNDFQEWDFTASYRAEIGPVFFLPGYNFRLHPNANRHDHGHTEHLMSNGLMMSDEAMPDHDDEPNGAHIHSKYNHELFIVVGTTYIPYVTPSVNFLWDLYQNGGGFVEGRLDGNIPIVKDVFTLRPYTLLGINLGYNTWTRLGLNNYQLGLQATLNVTRHIAVFAGVNYSVALPALRAIDQGNVVWADTGILVSF